MNFLIILFPSHNPFLGAHNDGHGKGERQEWVITMHISYICETDYWQ